MARKSLSSQVIEELDRAGRLLRSVADSVDPIIAHLLDEVAVSHQRIQDLCYAARTGPTDAVVSDTPLGTAFGPDKLAKVQRRSPATTKRPTTHKAVKP
jgi:hypothetical protein